MHQAAKRSPFAWGEAEEVPWVLWCNSESVSMLSIQTHTESQLHKSEDKSIADTSSSSASNHVQPIFQRQQYNAVMNRMNQAFRKTGNFSSWNQ